MIHENSLEKKFTSAVWSIPFVPQKPISTITDADVQLAKDINSGKFVPMPLRVPDPIRDSVESHFARLALEPTKADIQQAFDVATLGWLYPSDEVLLFQTEEGHNAILAIGFANVTAMQDRLTPQERSQVRSHSTTGITL